jgi:chromosome partitioning protein
LLEYELVGLHEIAAMAQVTTQAVANWRTRYSDFPEPVVALRSGPVFSREQVRKWLRRKRVPMTTIISTINLKGGVAKTTTTVAVAEILSASFRKRVLLIDLDPQTNATTMLIGEDRWKELNENGYTLAQLFKDALDEDRGDSKHKFDLEKTRQKRVSNVDDVPTLDLLPSSLDLIDVQDHLGSMRSGRFFASTPVEILRRAIRPIVDEYDYILIDCPPNLGIITLNGLRISSGYVIPVVPDILSTYGIPQIVTRVGAFSHAIGEPIEPLGIVISRYRAQSTVHRNTVQRLRAGNDAPVFDTMIPESNQIAASAEFVNVSTLRQKYGYQGQFDLYYTLTQEIVKAAG